MPSSIPLIIYFEGALQAGDTLYTYVSSVALNITGYRVLSRDGTALDVELRKNGTLLDVLEISGLDSGDVSLPNLYFSGDDTLTLTTPTTLATVLEGVTLIFNCTVEDSVDDSALANSRRIQTPFVSRYEGILTAGDTFFRFTALQRIEIFRYTITLRTAADANVIITVWKGSTAIGYITVLAGATTQTGLLSMYFNTGEEISLQLTTVGTVDAGESMQLLLDYRNTNQTVFSDFQTPFIVEYEGATIAAYTWLVYYSCPRTMTLAAVQLFSREPAASTLNLGIYRNGVLQTAFSITAGAQQTTPLALTIAYSEGDLLEVRLLNPDEITSALLLTLDYYISAGDNEVSFSYYSDPDTDIIILARQVGIGGRKADALPLEKLDKYKRDVDNILNGRLRALYRTPLAKVSGGNNPWPGAIQAIAQRMVLRHLLNDVYSEVEPNTSQNVAMQGQLAAEDLQLILNREILLEGQRYRSKNPGSNPCTEPLTPNQAAAPTVPAPR